eukprot:1488897-Rhodomonas_salina.1
MLKFHKHQHTCDQEANEDEQGLTLSQVVHDNHLFEFISEVRFPLPVDNLAAFADYTKRGSGQRASEQASKRRREGSRRERERGQRQLGERERGQRRLEAWGLQTWSMGSGDTQPCIRAQQLSLTPRAPPT